MRPEIRAFIFDMDGVITDTVELHYRAWLRLTQEEGIPFTQADNDYLRGLSRRDSLDYVFRGRALNAKTIETLMAHKNTYFLQLLQNMTPNDLLPGVARIIEEAHTVGIMVGLASSSQNVYPVLEKLGIEKSFDAIADHFSVARNKPAPDVFIWAAGRLNVSPMKALVFEDAQAGIEAARTGGCWTVGIGDPNIVSKAHIIVPNLASVTAQGLIDQLDAKT